MIPTGWRLCSFGEEYDEIREAYNNNGYRVERTWGAIGFLSAPSYENSYDGSKGSIRCHSQDTDGDVDLTNLCSCLGACADGRFFSFRFGNE